MGQLGDIKPPIADRRSKGSLVVVGTGIQWAGQTTLAARRAIEAADRVLFAVADAGTAGWLRSLRPDAVSLRYGSSDGPPRREIYRRMVDDILAEVRRDLRVCAVFYGHPGVFSTPAHEVIRLARGEGHSARMLPGVSFLDCLFADLGIDPGHEGCVTYEATDFLLRRRPFDIHTPLVLSQVAMIGNPHVFDPDATDRIRQGLSVLAEVLCARFPGSHEAILYDASTHPIEPPTIVKKPLGALASAPVTDVSTLYVPPVGPAPVDRAMRGRIVAGGTGTAAASRQVMFQQPTGGER
ncbi:SAM-dependent methyltransferase [Sorangium sp. So ce1036]|uniref:SAM-dependent methyltransferase n=1 Tax=Sorangium sp. So ce1036 TaxID=3133328 RepID=UPI003F105C8F